MAQGTTAAGLQAEDNRRETGRSGLLLAASFEAGPLSAPGRIRNLSETGAAIEGAVLPAPGAEIILRRLDLAVRGGVVWTSGIRCGVHFDRSIGVGLWMTGRRAAHDPADEPLGAMPLPAPGQSGTAAQRSTAAPAPAPARLDGRLAEELDLVRKLLEQLGDALSDEPAILARHATALQSFDLVNQILGHVSTVLIAEDRAAAIGAIGMEELRARLLGQKRA